MRQQMEQGREFVHILDPDPVKFQRDRLAFEYAVEGDWDMVLNVLEVDEVPFRFREVNWLASQFQYELVGNVVRWVKPYSGEWR